MRFSSTVKGDVRPCYADQFLRDKTQESNHFVKAGMYTKHVMNRFELTVRKGVTLHHVLTVEGPPWDYTTHGAFLIPF
jgi:hypothetical protein